MSFLRNLFEGKSGHKAPAYCDMGKDIKDLFSDDLDHQKVKVKVSSSTTENFDFKASGSHNKSTNQTCGDIEFKYKRPDYGFTYTESWDTVNNLNAKLELDKKIKGIPSTFCVNTGLVPLQNSNLYGEVVIKNSHDNITLDNSVKIKKDLSLIETCHQMVVGKGGLVLGGIIGYNWLDKNFSRYDSTIGLRGNTFQIIAGIYEKLNKCSGSFMHEVNPEFAYALKGEFSRTDAAVTVSGALKYKMNDSCTFRTTLNNHGLLGLSYRQALKPSVALVLNAEINTLAFTGGNHKSGLAIEITP